MSETSDSFYPDPILEDLIRCLAERLMVEVEQSTLAEDMYLQHDLLPLFTRIKLAFDANGFEPLNSDLQNLIRKIDQSIRTGNFWVCPDCKTTYLEQPLICEACGHAQQEARCRN